MVNNTRTCTSHLQFVWRYSCKGNLADYFNILAKVLKRNTLAPYLFAIVVAIHDNEDKFGITFQPRKNNRVPPAIVTNLNFANDIALLCNKIHQTQDLLKWVEFVADKVGLHLNYKKTEFISYNRDEPQNSNLCSQLTTEAIYKERICLFGFVIKKTSVFIKLL